MVYIHTHQCVFVEVHVESSYGVYTHSSVSLAELVLPLADYEVPVVHKNSI